MQIQESTCSVLYLSAHITLNFHLMYKRINGDSKRFYIILPIDVFVCLSPFVSFFPGLPANEFRVFLLDHQTQDGMFCRPKQLVSAANLMT